MRVLLIVADGLRIDLPTFACFCKGGDICCESTKLLDISPDEEWKGKSLI